MKQYSKKRNYHEGLCAVNIGYREVLTNQVYDPREGFMTQVVNNGKWGYIDADDNEVIPLIYEEAGDFNNGEAIVKLGGKKFCIDKQGRQIREIIYDSVGDFNNDLAIVRKNQKYGMINQSYEEIIPLNYDLLYPFSEGLATIRVNGKYGFINIKNEIIIQPIYSDASSFILSRAEVRKENKYGVIDKSGAEIIACIYDTLAIKDVGIIEAMLNEKYIYFNLNGDQITPEYNYSTNFYNSSFAVVGNGNCGKPWWKLNKMVGAKWGVINHRGEEVVPLSLDTYDEAVAAMKNITQD